MPASPSADQTLQFLLDAPMFGDLSPEELTRIVQDQADRVARRLRRQSLVARTVVLKVKTADFKQRTRRRRLHRAPRRWTQSRPPNKLLWVRRTLQRCAQRLAISSIAN